MTVKVRMTDSVNHEQFTTHETDQVSCELNWLSRGKWYPISELTLTHNPDFRTPAISIIQPQPGIRFNVFNLDGESREETPALIWLKQVTGAFIHGCRPEGLAESFVRLDGEKTRDISLTGNDLSRVKKVCEKGDGVPEDAVHIQAQ